MRPSARAAVERLQERAMGPISTVPDLRTRARHETGVGWGGFSSRRGEGLQTLKGANRPVRGSRGYVHHMQRRRRTPLSRPRDHHPGNSHAALGSASRHPFEEVERSRVALTMRAQDRVPGGGSALDSEV